MGRILVAIAALFLAGHIRTAMASDPAAPPLTPAAFTEAVAQAARAALPTAKITVAGELHLETKDAAGKGTTTDLRNAYEVYRRDPQHLVKIIHDYVGLLAETVRFGDGPAALDRSRIVPVFKSVRWVEALRAQAPKAPELLTEPFNSELTIVYAEDLEHSMRFLTTRDNVGDRARLHELALTNLSHLVPKVAVADADGIFVIGAGGNYEASLLLADAFWSGGQIKVDGDIVVAVPAKDALFVTGAHNAAGLTRMRQAAAKIAAGPYGLTSTLFVYRDGKFVKFDPN